MRKPLFLTAALLTLLVVTGCTVTFYAVRRNYYPYENAVVVSDTPPELRVERVGVAPSHRHIWVPGYWTWNGTWVWKSGRWVIRDVEDDTVMWQRGYWEYRNGIWFWVEGRWVTRTFANATWVPGHWERRPHGWVWIPGHWR